MLDLLSLLKDHQPHVALAVVLWFAWLGHQRESRLARKLETLHEEVRKLLRGELERSTRQLAINTDALKRTLPILNRLDKPHPAA